MTRPGTSCLPCPLQPSPSGLPQLLPKAGRLIPGTSCLPCPLQHLQVAARSCCPNRSTRPRDILPPLPTAAASGSPWLLRSGPGTLPPLPTAAASLLLRNRSTRPRDILPPLPTAASPSGRPAAAAQQVDSSHGHPASLAHCSISKWPPLAAAARGSTRPRDILPPLPTAAAPSSHP